MRTLSRKDIEGIAARVCEAYKKLPDFQGKPIYKIEPEKLVTDVLGLDIQFHHLSRYGSVLGVTSPCEVSYKVYDDADQDLACGSTTPIAKEIFAVSARSAWQTTNRIRTSLSAESIPSSERKTAATNAGTTATTISS